jgi:hypothetical protein
MSDNWDFYMTRVDDDPASIMVDLGIRETVPFITHKFMGYMRTKMKDPRPDGLSSQEEFETLCAIGDAVENALAAEDGAHIYVGRNTSGGHRDFYIYTSNLEQLHLCLGAVTRAFPQYDFILGGREDAEWSTYLDFLYPSPADKQRMMDRRVCEQLREQGDNLSIAREIDHRVYFSDKSKLKLYENYLRENDYVKIYIGKTKPILGERFIDFKHIGAPEAVSDVVYDLYTKAEELGGTYDGWGCSVITGEAGTLH